MAVSILLDGVDEYIKEEDLKECSQKASQIQKKLLEDKDESRVLGWRTLEESAVGLDVMRKKAEEIRKMADVFVIVGVGGSNQAARAMIEALKEERKGPEILYLGNTLSPYTISHTLEKLEGKSVYIDVIAKNFETLEPGSHFRILRQWMRKRYTKQEMANRIIVTGTVGSRLEEIAKEQGYLFLQFPVSVGGRYSAFTPVGLFPIMVAGLDEREFLNGVLMAMEDCKKNDENIAIQYAAVRNLLYQKHYDIEMLVSFEPQYAYLEKWWVQLFGESEGKDKKGSFPACAIYSEDLHSMGQYMQDGRRNLVETFLAVRNPKASVVIEPDPEIRDLFDYLDGVDFDDINKAAEKATLKAHTKGGVPCIRFEVDQICEKTFGELYYYFMMACAVSGKMMGVNPFDQEGVEEYKRSMFAALGESRG